MLLDAYADVNSTTGRGDTALHLPARCGHTKMVELLLSRNADFTMQNEHNDTVLHVAARHGLVEA